MAKWLANSSNPVIDFAFIDGGHDYFTARHDVLAALRSGRGAPVTLVLDDYGGVQGRDVKRLVDTTLAPKLPPECLTLFAMPQTEIEFVDNGEHGMAYLDARRANVTAAVLGGGRLSYAMHRMAARAEWGIASARNSVARWRGRV
jgi:hypothetical protein